jgi:hypothetical protein
MIALAVVAVAIRGGNLAVEVVGSILDDTHYVARRHVTKAWKVGPSPSVEVSLCEGYITVVQSTDGRVSATLSPFAVTKVSEAAANAALDDIAITATQQGDTIRISTITAPRFPMSQLKADIELRIPPDARLDLTTGHGYIYIGKAYRGPYGANLVSSPVALRSVKARDHGDVYTGIEAEIASRPPLPPAELDLVSRNGPVVVEGDHAVHVRQQP